MISDTNYHLQYFPNKEVTKISGEPTYYTLQNLHKQIKSNAASVPSTLGGGQHGHLGLVLDPLKYKTISLVPFQRPVDPGATPPFVNGMGWEEMQAVALIHANSCQLYQQVVAVETALRQQLTEAIEPAYLEELRNPISNVIEHPSNVIFETLFRNYGTIKTGELIEKYTELSAFNFNSDLPISTIYNYISGYEDLSIYTKSPVTKAQKKVYSLQYPNQDWKVQ